MLCKTMISSFQNFTGGTPAVVYNHHVAPTMYSDHRGQPVHEQQQLKSVFDAVAAAAVGQQPVPYHPADFGSPYAPQQPPRRYYETPRPSGMPTEPPNRKRPPQQQQQQQQPPPVQYTRVQGGVPGGKNNIIIIFCSGCLEF